MRINDVKNLCINYKVPLVVHTEWNDEYYPQYSHPFFVKQLAENNPDLNIVCSHIWNPRVIKSFSLTKKNCQMSFMIYRHFVWVNSFI